jgi:hypothetical protein
MIHTLYLSLIRITARLKIAGLPLAGIAAASLLWSVTPFGSQMKYHLLLESSLPERPPKKNDNSMRVKTYEKGI